MNNEPALDLKPKELKQVQQIIKRYIPEKQVCVFGSRAIGTAKSYSDLDLVVMAEQSLSLYQGAMLNEAFEESDLPFKVDVIDWTTISERFKKIIQSSLIPIERKETTEK